jgi:CheY-like chemotaxis protein
MVVLLHSACQTSFASTHGRYAIHEMTLFSPSRGETQLHAESTLTSLNRPHVLVMDENIDLLDLFGALLHDEGYAVTLSTTLLEPETIRRIRPDVIITELVFGHVDTGTRYLENLRTDPEFGRIRLFCCTGKSGDPAHVSSLVSAVISKPFNIDEVLILLQQESPGNSETVSAVSPWAVSGESTSPPES